MLDAHYKGKINISDYWAVGDSRTESIGEIPESSGTLNGNSYTYVYKQSTQDIELVIIGMNHDQLVSAVNGISDAAITIQTKDCLSEVGMPNNYKTSYGVPWGNSILKKYLNSNFLSAISEDLAKLIKPVYKTSSYYDSDPVSSTSYTTKDNIFILSEYEIFGKHDLTRYTSIEGDIQEYGSAKQDGTQYEYMMVASNRIKPDGYKNKWWMRTSYYLSQPNNYFYLTVDGETGDMNRTGGGSSTKGGIVPAFCL